MIQTNEFDFCVEPYSMSAGSSPATRETPLSDYNALLPIIRPRFHDLNLVQLSNFYYHSPSAPSAPNSHSRSDEQKNASERTAAGVSRIYLKHAQDILFWPQRSLAGKTY